MSKPGTTAYLLVGEAPSPPAAETIATRYRDCPYVHFIAAFGPMLVGVWYLPEAQRWWIEAVAEAPQVTLGLLRAAVYRTERPAHPAVFSPRVAGRGEVAPCGSICPDCERFDRCARCPATLHHRAE